MDDITNSPELCSFDAAAALSVVREVAGDDLRAFVEYTDENYNPLFIAGQVVEELGGKTETSELADQLHFNYKLDFNEREMYEDLYEPLGEVAAFAVFLEDEILIRYLEEREGLYVSVESGPNATRIVEALNNVMEADE
jgi:hypothetical protein